MFKGKIIKNESTDPKYKIKFSFASEYFTIDDGEALYIRKNPIPSIIFDQQTSDVIKQSTNCDDIMKKIELELGKTVIEHIISSTNDPENLRVSKNFSQKNAAT